ncbi:hypothetical protein KVT40_002687 [Elsinoe batatas]|uniref:Glutamyl-tRNA(Gln) amidotransferase subunit B, mitochondrial n=1 Tax=Elsinoe batatas TaxID=2601811 RepID=A0A8K0L463_9PEZI|nr:hypothetical protein KVT40_002687 [Elsinoe batatas]
MASPRTGTRRGTRKAHKKSHLGCVECKRRRIKCDETHPTCVACTARGATCSYDTFSIVPVSKFVNKTSDQKQPKSAGSPTTAVSGRSPARAPTSSQTRNAPDPDVGDTTFRPESLDDLRLLHHWSQYAAHTVTALPDLEDVFRRRVVEEGLKQPFLLHGVLALSALHAEYERVPPGPSPWRALAASHYATALRHYRIALADISDDKCSALFMFAIFAAVTALAMADKSSQNAITDLLESCRMWIGIVSVSHHVIAVVRDGPFAPMTGRNKDQTTEEPADYAVRVIQSLYNRVAYEPLEDRTAYFKLIEALDRLFHFKFVGPLEVARWLCQFEGSSIDLLQRRTNLGDAILAIMGAIIHDLDGFWWARGLGKALAGAVIPTLGPQWSELKTLVIDIIEHSVPENGKDARSEVALRFDFIHLPFASTIVTHYLDARYRAMRRAINNLNARSIVSSNQVAITRCLQHPSRSHQTSTSEPLRKQLKDKARHLKSTPKAPSPSPPSSDWELTVGIEIHARLNAATKLFSPAPLQPSPHPNTHIAPFDASLPGTQPQFQHSVLLPAIRAALALNCTIQPSSRWDRKHYFYQDQPTGYQITQYYAPFALAGLVTLGKHDLPSSPEVDGKGEVHVGIKQIQLEQDTAKSVSPPGTGQHLLDLSRVGAPLVEIISLPHIHSPGAAAAFVRKVRDVLRHVDACEGNMERGDLRADVNVSVRRRGSEGMGMGYAGVEGLGTRTEIKNLNSIRAVEEAVRAERNRQVKVLEEGGKVEGETRGWTVGGTETTRLRGKEGEVDYRYMPDPDLGPVWVGEEVVEVVRGTMPEGMEDTVERVKRDFGLSEKDAWTLFGLDDGERLEFAAEVSGLVKEVIGENGMRQKGLNEVKIAKAAANWVLHEIGGLLTTRNLQWAGMKVSTTDLSAILHHLLLKQITGRSAKQLLQTCFEGSAPGKSVDDLVMEANLQLRPMSEPEYQSLAQEILDENPDAVSAVKDKGQKGKVMFFVGQMMRKAEEGTVEADKAKAVFEQLLGLY